MFNLELQRLYAYLYQQSSKNYTILHALDGYDEISLTGPTKVVRNKTEMVITPEDFNITPLNPHSIYGGDSVASAAKIFTSILEGKGTAAQNDVVCANAAMAISTVQNCTPLEGFEKPKNHYNLVKHLVL